MELSDEQRITEILSAEPSASGWGSLCEILSRLSGEALSAALALAAPVKQWPTPMRWVSSHSEAATWLRPLFDGRVDPRLELVSWAFVSHSSALEGADGGFEPRSLYPITLAFAQYIDPSFAPLNVVVHADSDFISASGCGGGFAEEKRGDQTRGVLWYDTITEHKDDYSSSGDWKPYGLSGDYTLKIGRHERGNVDLFFAAGGATPMVLELAYAWGALRRSGVLTRESAEVALEESRRLWRRTT
jgi:hypothetical protein